MYSEIIGRLVQCLPEIHAFVVVTLTSMMVTDAIYVVLKTMLDLIAAVLEFGHRQRIAMHISE
jgi:hypothetical protein